MNSRRTLLKTGILAGGLSVAGMGASLYLGRYKEQREIAASLLEMLESPDRAQILGANLLSHTSGFQSASLSEMNTTLMEALHLNWDGSEEINQQMLLKRMHEKVREEFQEEYVVVVDGWLLSMTEARLCALAALYPDS